MTTEFHAQYGHSVDTSQVSGIWNISGPQALEHLPVAVRAAFEADPYVVEVIVRRKDDTGCVIRRRDDN